MYLYPPRAEQKIKPESLSQYDTGKFLGQVKYNGSASMLYMDGINFQKITNRYREDITNIKKAEIDFQGLYRGTGFIALAGELLNKNKNGEDGNPFNQKFIVWDILVYNGNYLVGYSTTERLELLENLYPCNRMQQGEKFESYEHLCCTGIKGVYRAPTYTKYFSDLYTDIVKTDLYEGFVLKRAEAKLEIGFREKNNSNWQLKCRKETKNYTF
jgi:ATP-dependent DNA ligase